MNPALNTPVLLAHQVNGRWVVDEDTWKGNLPAPDYRIVTPQEAQQLLQENVGIIQGEINQGIRGGWNTNNPSISRKQQEIAGIQSQVQKFANYSPKVGGVQYVIGPNGQLMTEANAKNYVSPEEGAKALKKAPSGTLLGAPVGSATPPTVNLKYGQSGAEVKQLQNFLISQGMKIPDGATGYFGNQTKAALLEWQQKAGVGGPAADLGRNWGPLSIAKATAAPSVGGGTTPTQGGDGTPTIGGAPSGTPDLTAVNAMIDGMEGVDQGQKDILKMYAQANFTKNPELAQNIMAALETSTRFSTPQFKQQAAMLMDGLKLNFSAQAGDLAFKEKVQKDSLAKAEQDYQAALAYGTAEEAQQLKQYRDKLENDIFDLADQMAASGLTSSSKRNRATEILNTENQGLVESATRKYGYQRAADERTIAATRTETADQLANLRRLAGEGNLANLRVAEGKLGSDALVSYGNSPSLLDGFSNLLGGQVGSENYDLTKTITGLASNFV